MRRTPRSPAGSAEQRGVAVGLADDAEQDLDERGLAGAVLAEQAVDLPLLDRERDALEGLDPAVVLAEIPRLDDRHGRLRKEVVRFDERIRRQAEDIETSAAVQQTGLRR